MYYYILDSISDYGNGQRRQGTHIVTTRVEKRMMKERLSYIDIAKGLLILLVVIHHTPQRIVALGMEDTFFQWVNSTNVCYIAWFMPAFFVVTGFVSRVKEDETFLLFILKNAKTILLPGFAIEFFLVLLGNRDFLSYFMKVVVVGLPSYWFLTALFVAKIFHWLINRYVCDNMYVRVAIYIALVAVGMILYELEIPEYWCVYHAMLLAVFLFVGQQLKKVGISKRLVWWSTFLLVLFTIVGILIPPIWKLPHVTQRIALSWIGCPLYLILATTGSIMILGLSKWIGKCAFFEFYGRNSLIVYCLHIAILSHILKPLHQFFDINIWSSALIFVAVLLITIGILYIAIRVLNLKYVRCLIGKF